MHSPARLKRPALALLALLAEATWADVPLPAVNVTAAPERDAILERAQRTQAREVRDLFAAEPEVDIGGGDRQSRRLYLRSIEGSNVNITVDGARQGQNLYNHRGGMLSVDPAILKRVDIAPGPAPADAGPGALGGSIRFETAEAQDLLRPGARLGGFARAGWASAAEAATLNLSAYGLLSDKLGLLVYGGGSNADLMRIGGGFRVPFSSYDDRNYLAKLSLIGANGHSLRLGHERNSTKGLNYQQRGDYPYQLQPPPGTRPPRMQTLTRETSTLNWRWDPATPLIDMEFALYRNENDWHSPDHFGERFISDGQGGKLQNTFAFDLAGIRNRLVIGVDHLEDSGAAYGNNLPAKPRASDNRNTGLYLQNRLEAGALKLSFGLRYDDYETLYGVKTVRGDVVSPNLSGEYALSKSFSVFAGYAQSARGWGTIPIHFARNITATASLPGKPEKALQRELGMRWRGAGPLSAELIAYATDIRDFIGYTHGGPPGSAGLGNRPVIAVWNQPQDIEHRGHSLKLAWTGKDLASSLAWAHQTTKNLPQWEPLWARAGAPRGDAWVWDNRWRVTQGLTLGYTLTAVERLRDLPTVAVAPVPPPPGTTHSRPIQIRERPGYVLHDIQVEWQPAGWRGLTLALAAQNLFDKRYSRHTTLSQGDFATEEPGRDIRVSVRYEW